MWFRIFCSNTLLDRARTMYIYCFYEISLSLWRHCKWCNPRRVLLFPVNLRLFLHSISSVVREMLLFLHSTLFKFIKFLLFFHPLNTQSWLVRVIGDTERQKICVARRLSTWKVYCCSGEASNWNATSQCSSQLLSRSNIPQSCFSDLVFWIDSWYWWDPWCWPTRDIIGRVQSSVLREHILLHPNSISVPGSCIQQINVHRIPSSNCSN